MKNSLLIATGIVLAIVLVIFVRGWWQSRSAPLESLHASYGVAADTYVGLRSQIFQSAREHAGIPPNFPANVPWAVVMDWGMQSGIATIVAVYDGTASMYYSTGGGNIGGGQSHESIRSAAKNALSVASKHVKQLKLVTEFPVPTRQGQVFFYVLTDSGVYFDEGGQEELASNHHPLSDLGNAMQEIITQYRITQK